MPVITRSQKWLVMFCLASVPCIAAAQSNYGPANQAPTAGVTTVPRTMGSLGYQRPAAQDSTMYGASSPGVGGAQSVPVPTPCEVDNTLYGCPGYTGSSNAQAQGAARASAPAPKREGDR